MSILGMFFSCNQLFNLIINLKMQSLSHTRTHSRTHTHTHTHLHNACHVVKRCAISSVEVEVISFAVSEPVLSAVGQATSQF
jgi:hypothetical protein